MTLRSRLRGAAIGAFLGADGARHALADLKRRVTGADRAIDFYFDLGDPASYLAAQAAQRLAEQYRLPVHFHLVSPPAADVDPAPALREHHALRDALEVARRWDVDFPGKKPAEPGILRRAAQVLMIARPDGERLALALQLAKAVWTNDPKEVVALMGKHGNEQSGSVAPYLASAYAKLRDAGHYQAASFAYGGDWYVGVERLHYLEARLRADTGITPPRAVIERRVGVLPEKLTLPATRPVPVELWFSFRSPYSYLAVPQMKALAAELPIALRLRPVLPMVMRGLAVPRVKQLYLARDARREAERLGLPFGNVADPLGKGAEHGLAITYALLKRGADALPFVESATRGAWAEALDLASYVDLRTVVERAGVDWEVARAALADEAWRVDAADAAADLNAAGLWGVPSFRVGDHATWGQDRIPYLAERLRASL